MVDKQEIYENAFNDELEKLSYEYGQGIFKKNEEISIANKVYDDKLEIAGNQLDKDLEPWERADKAFTRANSIGAILGTSAAIPKGGFRITRGLVGALVGLYGTSAIAGRIIEKKNPGFLKSRGEAWERFYETDENAFQELEDSVSVSKVGY